MTKTGPRSKRGHLAREWGGSRSFCGLALGGGRFTDEATRPVVCQRCVGGLERRYLSDHHHVVFVDGRWVCAVPGPRVYLSSNVVTYMASACGIDGCSRMVPHRSIPGNTGTTSAGNTYYFKWGTGTAA